MDIDRSRYPRERMEAARRWLAEKRAPRWVIEEWTLDYHELDGRGYVSWEYPVFTEIDWRSRTWTVYDPCDLKPKDIIPLCQLIAATKAWLDPAVWQSRSEREFAIQAEWTSLDRKVVDLEIRQQKNREAGKKSGLSRRKEIEQRNDDIIRTATSLLQHKRPPRSLAGILEKRFRESHGLTDRQIRTILQKAGLLPKKKGK